MKQFFLLGIAGILGYGLFKKARIQYYKAQGWDWELRQFRIISVTTRYLRAYIELILKNTSDIPAVVKDVNVKAYSEGVYLGSGVRSAEHTVLGSGQNVFGFTADVDFSSVKSNAQALLRNVAENKDLPITFTGSFKMKQGVLWINIPFEYETSAKTLYSYL